MTRKDLELIARAIKTSYEESHHPDRQMGIRLVANYIAAEVKSDNPRLNASRFLEACEVNG